MWIQQLIKRSNPFLALYGLFLLAGGLTLLTFDKESLHLGINKFHSPFLDFFFKYFTFVGDGITVVLMVIILLFIKYRYAIFLALSSTLTSLVTQFLKRFVFDSYVRPSVFFENSDSLYTVPGVELNSLFSFPSGHTSAGFCLFFVLAIIFKRNWLSIICFFMALLTGFSRVYLSQHFFDDIYAGSAIGVLITLFTFGVMDWYKDFFQKNWMEKSLLG